MKSLIDIYNENRHVSFSEIPENWIDSFNKFIYGQACMIDKETNERLCYSWDFRVWYHQNQVQIERDFKIDQVL